MSRIEGFEKQSSNDNFAALRQFFSSPQELFTKFSAKDGGGIEADFGALAISGAGSASPALWNGLDKVPAAAAQAFKGLEG